MNAVTTTATDSAFYTINRQKSSLPHDLVNERRHSGAKKEQRDKNRSFCCGALSKRDAPKRIQASNDSKGNDEYQIHRLPFWCENRGCKSATIGTILRHRKTSKVAVFGGVYILSLTQKLA